MQIVLNISKKLYDRYKEKDHIKRCDIDEFEKALDRCIILPKGHGRLLDEKIIIGNAVKGLNGIYDLTDMPDYIAELPAYIPADKEKE